MNKKRIVITGVGVVSPIGIGKEEFFHSLEEGNSGIKPITLFDVSKYKVKVAGEITEFDPVAILGKRGLLDLDRATKLLLCSTKLALDDANLEVTEENSSRMGVSVGTTFGSLSSISRFNRESILEGPKYANPSVFPNTVNNSPASRVGIKFMIKGFNSTISTGMCAALDALDYACDFIHLNRIHTGIVGAVEELSIQMFLGCYKLKYMSGLNGNHEPTSRPFDKRRDGIVLGEGATTVVVEDLETALQRKTNIYCEILGIASCFEPGRYYKYKSSGDGMTRAMTMALINARLKPEDIDGIFANANSTRDADKIESKAIGKVFGENSKALITSVKSLIGESFSVSGGFSLVAAIAALNKKFISPTINYFEKDQECGLNYVINKKVHKNISKVMINTFSPNGANTVVIIGGFK